MRKRRMALEEKTARVGRERAAMVLKFKGFGVSSLSAVRSNRSYNFNIEKKEKKERTFLDGVEEETSDV